MYNNQANSLADKIYSAILDIDESLGYDILAKAIAIVLQDNYGSHNYNLFIAKLKNELNNDSIEFDNQIATQKLRQETSTTSAGAAFTPGAGEQYTSAPSIPNRKSKAFTYKKIFENEIINENYIPDNIKKFAKRKGVTSELNQIAKWVEKAGKRIVGGTAIGKNYDTLILDLTYQGAEIYYDIDTNMIKVNRQKVNSYDDFIAAVKLKDTNINENYSKFKKETKTRTNEQQLHAAMRLAEKKIYETNKILEYTSQLKNELNETRVNKNTQNLMEKITKGIANAYSKIKKLK